jgi:hypothetical protein
LPENSDKPSKRGRAYKTARVARIERASEELQHIPECLEDCQVDGIRTCELGIRPTPCHAANGEHVIDKHGKHTATAQVVDGKIAGVKVKHSEKGDVAVRKVKSSKKMAQADGIKVAQADALQPVALMTVQAQDLGTTYIGYSYIDDNGDEVVYWFPYDMILDGDTGAVTYVPVA